MQDKHGMQDERIHASIIPTVNVTEAQTTCIQFQLLLFIKITQNIGDIF